MAEPDTYLVLDDFEGRLDCAWRDTDAESADRDLLDVRWRWRANVRQHTEQGAADQGYDADPDGDHCAHGFRSTASTLFNEEGAFDGDVVGTQLAHDTEKKSAGGATRWCGASLARPKNKIRGIYNRATYWAEHVRLMQHRSDRLDSLRDGAPAVSLRRSAA
jgi:hypothetical protein